MITLTGITWNHTRGYLPMVASAQRFHELYPDVEIRWEKRSLQAFADQSIQQLAEIFDLLVIDHPFVGSAAACPMILPLDDFVASSFLEEHARNSVGASHASYICGGHQWALAIDAAAPVSARRPDLLAAPPGSWDELIRLAKQGHVAVPAIPVDSLMNFQMLCIGHGEEPFEDAGEVVSQEVGMASLERLRELVTACGPACLQRNPIATYEAMTVGDDLAYCPFAFGYSNYARPGYARKLLHFGNLLDGMRSTLGGTGLAVSAHSPHRQSAVEYARFVASVECQRGLYVHSGGQPAHRCAWKDAEANRITNGYFHSTLSTLDEAFLRPRYNGYLRFQEEAGMIVHEFLRNGSTTRGALRNHLKS